MPAVVYGLREAMAAFNKAEKEAKKAWRDNLRSVAQPVRVDAAAFAKTRISHIGPRWYRMRIGISQREGLVYVAPMQRGVKTRGPDPRRRPNLAPLLMDKAMEPALQQHEPEIVEAVERMLDQIADHFNHGGHV